MQLLSFLFSVSCALQLLLCLAWAKFQMTDVSVPAAQRGRVCDSCSCMWSCGWWEGGCSGLVGNAASSPLPSDKTAQRYNTITHSVLNIVCLCLWHIDSKAGTYNITFSFQFHNTKLRICKHWLLRWWWGKNILISKWVILSGLSVDVGWLLQDCIKVPLSAMPPSKRHH